MINDNLTIQRMIECKYESISKYKLYGLKTMKITRTIIKRILKISNWQFNVFPLNEN